MPPRPRSPSTRYRSPRVVPAGKRPSSEDALEEEGGLSRSAALVSVGGAESSGAAHCGQKRPGSRNAAWHDGQRILTGITLLSGRTFIIHCRSLFAVLPTWPGN